MPIPKRPLATAPRNDEGAIAIIAVLSIPVLLGFAGLAIDSGYQTLLKGQLQDVADAAAHAGALGLDLTSNGLDAAWDNASAIAQANTVGGKNYQLEANEFEWGIWNSENRVFTPYSADPFKVNAVRISGKYTVDALVGELVVPELKLHGEAIAVAARFPVSSGCALPIAVPSCAFAGKSPEDICGMDLVFNADTVDTAGWASLGASQPNANGIRQQIADATSGTCSDEETSDVDQDVITLNNGSITNALRSVTSAIESSPTYWNTSELGKLPKQDPKSSILRGKYGSTLEGLIYVYTDPANCNGTKYVGPKALEGYAHAVIYDVVDNAKATSRKIKARLSCTSSRSDVTSTSAGNFGVLGGVAIVQ